VAALSATPDGGALILLSNQIGSSSIEQQVVKFDSTGVELWRHTAPRSMRWYPFAEALPDGGFVAAGIAATASWGGVALTRLDADGNVLFSRAYGDSLSPQAVTHCPDGGFLVFATAGNYRDLPTLLRFNAAGDSLWSRQDSSYLLNGRVLQADGAGGFLLAGSDYYGAPAVLRIDGTGTPLQSSSYSAWHTGMIVDLTQTADGGWIAACFDPGWEFTPTGPYKIARGTASGETQWLVTSHVDRGEWALAMQPLPDGAMLVCGTNLEISGESYRYSLYRAKLSPDGQFLWERTVSL
jgi:hypothetical protein